MQYMENFASNKLIIKRLKGIMLERIINCITLMLFIQSPSLLSVLNLMGDPV